MSLRILITQLFVQNMKGMDSDTSIPGLQHEPKRSIELTKGNSKLTLLIQRTFN